MTQFPTAAHPRLAGRDMPRSNESDGRIKSTKTRPGNPYLKGAVHAG